MKRFLAQDIWVVRIKTEESENFIPYYIYIEIENKLPKLLDERKPKKSGKGLYIPNSETPNENILLDCPVAIIPLDQQVAQIFPNPDPAMPPLSDLLHGLIEGRRKMEVVLGCLSKEHIDILELLSHINSHRQEYMEGFQNAWDKKWPININSDRGIEFVIEMGGKMQKLANFLQNSDGVKAYDTREELEVLLDKNCDLTNEKVEDRTIFTNIVAAKLRLALPSRKRLFATIVAQKAETEKKLREAKIRAEERLRITRSIFHHLKNLVAAAVIDPLELIRRQGLDKKGIIDKALRGANLLREIINAMNLASSGKPEDFLADLQEPGENTFTLGVIVEISLRSAFANMFDAKYFNKYHFVYFPKSAPERLQEAKEKFINIPTGDIEQLLDFGRNYLIKNIQWSCPESILDIKIGNSHNSALKLIVLFQELFLNAVKYVTLVDADTRRLEIALQSSPKGAEVTIFNSYNSDPWKQPGDTLIGKSIIDDLMNQLGFSPLSGKEQPGLRHFNIPLL